VAGNLISLTHFNGASMSYTYDTLNRLSTVVDNNLPAGQNTTTYAYDTASNLVTVTDPNQLQSTIQYDSLNRLTSLNTVAPNSSAVAGYSYTLGATGNRIGATEQTGRTLTWNYDGIYRLTSEAVQDPSGGNGAVSYEFDPVGNRTSANSSLPGVQTVSLSSFNLDDLLSGETYDANGNTTYTGGRSFVYDSGNRLRSMNNGAVSIIYDGFGNRVAKTVGGVTTKYLVEDDVNPTGLPQVMEETVNNVVQRTYTYGFQRISENQLINNVWTPSFYEYDGSGSVRQLTNLAANVTVTDTYNYDAFGNLLNSTGTTPNNYLYRGEQYDKDLGLYYLRARYYNPQTDRFLSRDPNDGDPTDPKTLHKYLYASGDPVNRIDPRGREDLIECVETCGEEVVEVEEVEEVEVKTELKEAEQQICWPPDRGFEPGTAEPYTLPKETIIDRYGDPNGTMTAPAGTPFPERALPPSYANAPLSTYKVVQPIDVMQGLTRSWFNQPGGGIQYLMPAGCEELVGGSLEKIE